LELINNIKFARNLELNSPSKGGDYREFFAKRRISPFGGGWGGTRNTQIFNFIANAKIVKELKKYYIYICGLTLREDEKNNLPV